jgi:Signal peptide binding domain
MASESALSRFRQTIVPLAVIDAESMEWILTTLEEEDRDEILEDARKWRLWCGIIDAMTPFERDSPKIVLGHSRATRIARGAGATIRAVYECMNCFFASLRVFNARFSADLCEHTHASLLVGTCPWCGCAILPERSPVAESRGVG